MSNRKSDIEVLLQRTGKLMSREDLEARGLTGANALPPSAPGSSVAPREVQYWELQDDGSYMWSGWLNSADPAARVLQEDLTCEKCGELMSGRRRRLR